MKEEHCEKCLGCDEEFETVHGKITTAKTEFDIVVGGKPFTPAGGRRAINLRELSESTLAVQSKMDYIEVLAVVSTCTPL